MPPKREDNSSASQSVNFDQISQADLEFLDVVRAQTLGKEWYKYLFEAAGDIKFGYALWQIAKRANAVNNGGNRRSALRNFVASASGYSLPKDPDEKAERLAVINAIEGKTQEVKAAWDKVTAENRVFPAMTEGELADALEEGEKAKLMEESGVNAMQLGAELANLCAAYYQDCEVGFRRSMSVIRSAFFERMMERISRQPDILHHYGVVRIVIRNAVSAILHSSCDFEQRETQNLIDAAFVESDSARNAKSAILHPNYDVAQREIQNLIEIVFYVEQDGSFEFWRGFRMFEGELAFFQGFIEAMGQRLNHFARFSDEPLRYNLRYPIMEILSLINYDFLKLLERPLELYHDDVYAKSDYNLKAWNEIHSRMDILENCQNQRRLAYLFEVSALKREGEQGGFETKDFVDEIARVRSFCQKPLTDNPKLKVRIERFLKSALTDSKTSRLKQVAKLLTADEKHSLFDEQSLVRESLLQELPSRGITKKFQDFCKIIRPLNPDFNRNLIARFGVDYVGREIGIDAQLEVGFLLNSVISELIKAAQRGDSASFNRIFDAAQRNGRYDAIVTNPEFAKSIASSALSSKSAFVFDSASKHISKNIIKAAAYDPENLKELKSFVIFKELLKEATAEQRAMLCDKALLNTLARNAFEQNNKSFLQYLLYDLPNVEIDGRRLFGQSGAEILHEFFTQDSWSSFNLRDVNFLSNVDCFMLVFQHEGFREAKEEVISRFFPTSASVDFKFFFLSKGTAQFNNATREKKNIETIAAAVANNLNEEQIGEIGSLLTERKMKRVGMSRWLLSRALEVKFPEPKIREILKLASQNGRLLDDMIKEAVLDFKLFESILKVVSREKIENPRVPEVTARKEGIVRRVVDRVMIANTIKKEEMLRLLFANMDEVERTNFLDQYGVEMVMHFIQNPSEVNFHALRFILVKSPTDSVFKRAVSTCLAGMTPNEIASVQNIVGAELEVGSFYEKTFLYQAICLLDSELKPTELPEHLLNPLRNFNHIASLQKGSLRSGAMKKQDHRSFDLTQTLFNKILKAEKPQDARRKYGELPEWQKELITRFLVKFLRFVRENKNSIELFAMKYMITADLGKNSQNAAIGKVVNNNSFPVDSDARSIKILKQAPMEIAALIAEMLFEYEPSRIKVQYEEMSSAMRRDLDRSVFAAASEDIRLKIAGYIKELKLGIDVVLDAKANQKDWGEEEVEFDAQMEEGEEAIAVDDVNYAMNRNVVEMEEEEEEEAPVQRSGEAVVTEQQERWNYLAANSAFQKSAFSSVSQGQSAFSSQGRVSVKRESDDQEYSSDRVKRSEPFAAAAAAESYTPQPTREAVGAAAADSSYLSQFAAVAAPYQYQLQSRGQPFAAAAAASSRHDPFAPASRRAPSGSPADPNAAKSRQDQGQGKID